MSKSKKIISVALSATMVLSGLTIGAITTNAAQKTDEVSASSTAVVSSGSQAAQKTIGGSAILHCFDWSYNSIRENLQAIKDAGYTAVQTSPVMPAKDYNASWTDQSGQWWKLYQPLDIAIGDGNTWLGTKAELKALCDAAEDMGIKVVCDIVANHLADKDGSGNVESNINANVASDLKKSEYFHLNGQWANDDNNRYTVTQGSIGQPDLNTGNSYIQQRYKNLLIELVNLGVDGFRFDAAKHIELPSDGSYGSQFWPTVLNGAQSASSEDIFFYGEVLNYAGTDISNYTKYMNITDNYSSDCILVAANNGNASGMANSAYTKGAGASKSILWAESHDTYMGKSGSAGLENTAGVSDATVVRAYAMVGSRANSTSLFFARPAEDMGDASTDTTYKSKAVTEINKFKNYFDGQSEYLGSSGSIAYNVRGTSGAVLANSSNNGATVNFSIKNLANGTYKDQISGSTFTVSNGTISGTIGSTGVAVIYNAEPEGPSASVTPGSSSFKTDTYTLTLNYDNATSGQYSIDGGAYTSYTNGQKIEIGKGVAYDTKITVTVKASDGTTTSEPVTYTYTKVDPTKIETVYYDNSTTNWSTVYAYMWSDENPKMMTWPGVQMTKVSGNVYSAEIPEGATNIIFNNNADQSDDLTLQGSGMIYRNGSWSAYDVPTTTVPSTTAPATTSPATTAPVTQPTTAGERVLIGDTTLDGRITVSDATLIQMHTVQLTTLADKALTAADVDMDGTVSIKDATLVQRYIVKLDNYGYCGTYIGGEEPTTAPVTEEPTTTPVSETYVYAKGYTHAYFWNDDTPSMGGAWPGQAMESIGNGVYRIAVPEGATNVIFSNSGNNQTGDLTVNAGKLYANGSWTSFDTTPTEPTTTPSGTVYVYAKGYTHAYFWADGTPDLAGAWPGTAMESVGDGVYRIAVPTGATSVIFSNGGNNQTGDLTVNAGKLYENGSWSDYNA